MSNRHTQHKHLVMGFWESLSMLKDPALQDVAKYLSDDLVYYGFYPIKKLTDANTYLANVLKPLADAFPDLMHRPYVLIGNTFEGRDWVANTGEFIGTFVNDWLGIPANGQTVKFRYGEFLRFNTDKKIDEIRMIVDLPDLIRQVDDPVLPPNNARDVWIPGPLAGDGIRLGEEDSPESSKTLELVESMIFGGLNKFDGDQESQGLERYWHTDMVWHGPLGMGSAYGMDEFKKDAQGPSVNAFPDRKGVGHQARIADGLYAASTGWPSLVGTNKRSIFGFEPIHKRIGWDIMDFWRRDGNKLRENWVLVDILDFAHQCGTSPYPPLKDYEIGVIERDLSHYDI